MQSVSEQFFVEYIHVATSETWQNSLQKEPILSFQPPLFRSNHRRCSIKKLFLKISEISQKNNCVGVSFLMRLQDRCFPVKFAKVLRTPILNSICERLLLSVLFSEAYLGVPPTSHTKSYVPKVLEEVVKIFSIMCFITIFCKFCVYSK